MKRDTIFALIEEERRRQSETLALIPSENYASKAVREAVGSVLMNKYAEGQAGSRYYQGNKVVDEVESLCKKRALDAFGLDHGEWGVNVQAHSGSPANLAVYNALLNPGDKIMAMFLPDGGHLSHGWKLERSIKSTKGTRSTKTGERKITLVSKIWDVEFYKTDEKTRLLDYDQIERQARKFKPRLIISGGTAYPREIDYERMGKIAKGVGAYYLADIAHEAGLVAVGVCKSPFESADVVTMTTHKTLRGPRGAIIFSRKKSEARSQKLGASGDLSKLVDSSVFPGLQGGPHLHSIAGIAVCLREVMSDEFKQYAKQVVVNAQVLAEGLKKKGFDVVSGGTDKHLVLVDLRNRKLSGWVVAWALEMAGIIVNRNTVPQESASPFYPSGLRLGTPTVTTRGMREKEMKVIVEWIGRVVEVVKDERLPDDKDKRREFVGDFVKRVFEEKELLMIREEVEDMCVKFPIDKL